MLKVALAGIRPPNLGTYPLGSGRANRGWVSSCRNGGGASSQVQIGKVARNVEGRLGRNQAAEPRHVPAGVGPGKSGMGELVPERGRRFIASSDRKGSAEC